LGGQETIFRPHLTSHPLFSFVIWGYGNFDPMVGALGLTSAGQQVHADSGSLFCLRISQPHGEFSAVHFSASCDSGWTVKGVFCPPLSPRGPMSGTDVPVVRQRRMDSEEASNCQPVGHEHPRLNRQRSSPHHTTPPPPPPARPPPARPGMPVGLSLAANLLGGDKIKPSRRSWARAFPSMAAIESRLPFSYSRCCPHPFQRLFLH